MAPYERFLAWTFCHEFVLAAYRASRQWPSEERFGLTAQLRRAAVSSAANIVEGSAKRGAREFRRYLDISLGSIAECGYYLRLAHDLGILKPSEHRELSDLQQKAARATWKLYRSLTPAG